MKLKIYHSISEFTAGFGISNQHPHLYVGRMEDTSYVRIEGQYCFDFYHIYLNEQKCGSVKYGQQYYDFGESTMMFIGPMQVLEEEREEHDVANGWVLMFDAQLLQGSSLAQEIKKCSFFSYRANEALRLLTEEYVVVEECLKRIASEAQSDMDDYTEAIILAELEVLMNRVKRYYDRQFSVFSTSDNDDVLAKFDHLIDHYIEAELWKTDDKLSVAYCADQLHYSPNYLGDMIRTKTGRSAIEHIHKKLMDAAKEKLFGTNLPVSEIAYSLGFDYPQYFCRLFKKSTGMSPSEYRLSLTR